MTHAASFDLSLEDDRHLLAMVQQGDMVAMAYLFDRHSKTIFGAALRVLRQHACAEDIRQEIFLQLWRKPSTFSAVCGNVGSWLAASSRNRSIDTLRKRRYWDTIEGLECLSACDIVEQCEHNIALEKLMPFIHELPERQQEMLQMAFVFGYTHSEIAKQVGRPLGTVKTTIRDALETLRTRTAHASAARH